MLVFACPGQVRAADSRTGILKLDPSRTTVAFVLQGSLHTTHGEFQLESGTIKADEKTGQAEGEITIDAASGRSGDFLRDRRMRDDVLRSATWPEIKFTPHRVKGYLDQQGILRASLEGILVLQGVSHEVAIEVDGRLSGRELFATGHLSIPYVQWGLEDPSVLFLSVAKEVEIKITTTGYVEWVNQDGISNGSRGLGIEQSP